jgi:chromosome segregation ATPase
MSVDEKVKQLESTTSDLARLASQAQAKLGDNEARMIDISGRMDEGHRSIIAALATLQESQNIHMARSEEKFKGQGKTLDRLVDKIDSTSNIVSGNTQLTETLQNHTRSLFKRVDQTDKDVASCMASHGIKPEKGGAAFIDSPNFRWVMMPIIIILLGLFGLAGFNMMGSPPALMSLLGGQ